jgi:hypothetical protein
MRSSHVYKSLLAVISVGVDMFAIVAVAAALTAALVR